MYAFFSPLAQSNVQKFAYYRVAENLLPDRFLKWYSLFFSCNLRINRQCSCYRSVSFFISLCRRQKQPGCRQLVRQMNQIQLLKWYVKYLAKFSITSLILYKPTTLKYIQYKFYFSKTCISKYL